MKQMMIVRFACLAVLVTLGTGCSLVTIPLDIAYGVTKGVVKGTVAVVDAVTPDLNSKDDDKKSKDAEKK